MEDSRDGQTCCDWCHGPLTPGSIEQSEHLGLDGEYSWACESGLDSEGYRHPPDGWGGSLPSGRSVVPDRVGQRVRDVEPSACK
jgi:hypothetical protein